MLFRKQILSLKSDPYKRDQLSKERFPSSFPLRASREANKNSVVSFVKLINGKWRLGSQHNIMSGKRGSGIY